MYVCVSSGVVWGCGCFGCVRAKRREGGRGLFSLSFAPPPPPPPPLPTKPVARQLSPSLPNAPRHDYYFSDPTKHPGFIERDLEAPQKDSSDARKRGEGKETPQAMRAPAWRP